MVELCSEETQYKPERFPGNCLTHFVSVESDCQTPRSHSGLFHCFIPISHVFDLISLHLSSTGRRFIIIIILLIITSIQIHTNIQNRTYFRSDGQIDVGGRRWWRALKVRRSVLKQMRCLMGSQ